MGETDCANSSNIASLTFELVKPNRPKASTFVRFSNFRSAKMGSGVIVSCLTLPGSRRDQMFIASRPALGRAPAERDVSLRTG